MASQSLQSFLILTTLLLATILSQSPQNYHAEGRSVQKRAFPETTTADHSELTTVEHSPVNDATPTPLKLSTAVSTAQSITEVTTKLVTEASNPTSTESESFTPSHKPNRSLYEELRSTASLPNFSSSFETSSEFMKKFDLLNIEESDESKSHELTLDESFQKDEMGFKNNETREERHSIDEARFDSKTIEYSSININRTEPEDDPETTALPLSTTMKKGKYLELVPPTDDNINSSIPNTAEVWALAGMRDVESRKPAESDESSSDVELLSGNMNNTAKNLLDWIEIAKMDNDTMNPNASDENSLAKTTVQNDLNGDDDPATSENREAPKITATSLKPSTTASTQKTAVEDNRLELESENVELGSLNKTNAVNSRIDSDVFVNGHDDKEESDIELIDSYKKGDKKEGLRSDEVEIRSDSLTTSSSEAFTTDSTELMETTTIEATTSIIDSFTVIGEDEEGDEIFKRTITELPPMTTNEPETTVTTTQTSSTTVERFDTTTEIPKLAVTEAPETTTRLSKSTKTIRATTTATPRAEIETTLFDSSGFFSTLIPKFSSTRQAAQVTTLHHDFVIDSTTSSAVEIIDNDKFKYSTLLPETTTQTEAFGAKSGGFEESTTFKVDSLNKESLDGEQNEGSSLGLISALVSVAVVLVVAGAAYFIYKRRNMQKFSQRCRPVGLDAYSLDNVSVYNSVRRKANALRLSKRTYGNSAFEDPSLQSNVLDYHSLQDFTKNKSSIHDEFKEIPQVSVRVDESMPGVEDKNRYANVVPLPETQVHLQRMFDDDKSEYINANFVKGPKDSTNYYIATQAPLENTVPDFWRMIWEQNSKVIIMATDLTENGVERCAEYIPASVVLDNSQAFGDFQVTLKSREVKGKYAVSQLHVKNLKSNTWREIMHLWYSWPENGCPTDETSIINLLLDARGYLRTNLPEQLDENSNTDINKDLNDKEKLSTLEKTKSLQRVQGPLTVHCSPGTGRSGTLIACDIILRMLEVPPRQIDIPQIVYCVRRGRANAIRTKDQYEFIYNVANAYAIKLNTAPAEH